MPAIQSYTNLTAPDGAEEIVVSDVTNSNVTRNIPTAILMEDLHLSKSVAGASDVALTNAESLKGSLTFTGELTGNINVTVPDGRERLYVVYNNTTGSFTLTLKTVSGTGVTIAQNARELVSSNGTNVVGPLSAIPSGFIGLWSGAISAIPTGWAICDGTNGTPNLTDRFVIHADADAAGTRNVGDTGGSNTMLDHTHTGTTNNPGDHVHGLPAGSAVGLGSELLGANTASGTVTSGLSGGHSHTVSVGSGSAAASTPSIPKFYALAYIMKL
jgi:hypothetical protein